MSEISPALLVSSPEDFPTCPRCAAPLAETMTVKALDVAVGEESASVKIAYCGRCGSALGTIP